MIDKLEELKKRYLEVESDLSKPETVSDMGLFKKLNKEYKSLGKIVTAYHQYKETMVGIDEAKNIIETDVTHKDIYYLCCAGELWPNSFYTITLKRNYTKF